MEINISTVSKKIQKLSKMQLQQLIIHLNSELSKCKEKVREYQEDYHYSQLESLKIENRKLIEEKKQLKIALDEQKTIEKQLEELQAERKQWTLEKEQWMNDIHEYQKKISDQSQKIGQLIKDRDHYEKLYEMTITKFEQLQDDYNANMKLVEEASVFKAQHYHLKAEIKQALETVSKLENENKHLQEMNDQYVQKIKSLTKLTETMEKNVDKLTSENNTISATKNVDLEDRQKEQIWPNQMEELTYFVKEYTGKLSSSISFIQQLEEQIQSLKFEIDSLKKELSN
ncbi:hypothetical protein [Aeribacillus alveayuensis]|uniref:Chromosome segregation ATPase n=1 Tax=Aeribacillus alveayuensis TaxID=279215 RepID=A0ABT9VNF3_9BACI|nr:chromosome segregation ATPase [Bacillus alveayuensis]